MALQLTFDRIVKILLISSEGVGELDPKLSVYSPEVPHEDQLVETNKLFIPTGMTIEIEIEYDGNIYHFTFKDWRFKPKKGRGNDAWADWDIQGESHSQHFDDIDRRRHTLMTWPFKLECVHIPTYD